MGCKRIYSAHVCLPKPRLLRRRREELHEHHRHTILLAFSTLLLIQLRRRESTIVMAYTRHSASQRAIFLPEQTFLACFAKKKEEPFLQIEIRGGIVLGALKYPLKIWQREGRGYAKKGEERRCPWRIILWCTYPGKLPFLGGRGKDGA